MALGRVPGTPYLTLKIKYAVPAASGELQGVTPKIKYGFPGTACPRNCREAVLTFNGQRVAAVEPIVVNLLVDDFEKFTHVLGLVSTDDEFILVV